MIVTTTQYAAMIGCRMVDIYPCLEDALHDLRSFPNGWAFKIPTGSTIMDALQSKSYEGLPLYAARW